MNTEVIGSDSLLKDVDNNNKVDKILNNKHTIRLFILQFRVTFTHKKGNNSTVPPCILLIRGFCLIFVCGVAPETTPKYNNNGWWLDKWWSYGHLTW